MELNKILKLNNGSTVLIDNISYNVIYRENGDILFQKNSNINITDIKDIKKYDFLKSAIIECLIDKKEFSELKYKPILKKIYEIINDGTKIIKNTKMNIKTIKKEDDGFYYLDNIGISIQGVDSNKCLLEIINQCMKNNIELFIKIKLYNNAVINISF